MRRAAVAHVGLATKQGALHHQALHRADEEHGGCFLVEAGRQLAGLLGMPSELTRRWR